MKVQTQSSTIGTKGLITSAGIHVASRSTMKGLKPSHQREAAV